MPKVFSPKSPNTAFCGVNERSSRIWAIGEIEFGPGFEVFVFFENQRRVYFMLWQKCEMAIAGEITRFCIGICITDKQFGDTNGNFCVRFKSFADDGCLRVRKAVDAHSIGT
ncbi:MAG: hypothetical protein IPP63_02440 [Chloracidobacterium sp.]|nr:hypothetical protein [Chloracidobacterium sp.]